MARDMVNSKRRDTRLVHAGSHPEMHRGVMNPPVFRGSTVLFPTLDAMEKASAEPLEGVYYGRHGTPTSFALEEAVAELESADNAISVSSGLAAITVGLISFLGTGDHILIADTVYGPTRALCDRLLTRYGISVTYFDPLIGEAISNLFTPETKLVFTESPGSLTFEVQDIPAITEVAHEHGALVLLDNTWSGGLYFAPFDHGVDISIQAATKYIGGHADIMLGTLSMRDTHYQHVKSTAVRMGYCAAPDVCYLALRGLRTLPVRLARHEKNGLALAEWFAARPEIVQVLHPARPDCPGHEIWQRDFTGASGLFGIILRDGIAREQLADMLDGMSYFGMGYSWGGFESLMIPTSPGEYRTATKWTETGQALRVHAGQESLDDLIDDLERGFRRLNGT